MIQFAATARQFSLKFLDTIFGVFFLESHFLFSLTDKEDVTYTGNYPDIKEEHAVVLEVQFDIINSY